MFDCTQAVLPAPAGDALPLPVAVPVRPVAATGSASDAWCRLRVGHALDGLFRRLGAGRIVRPLRDSDVARAERLPVSPCFCEGCCQPECCRSALEDEDSVQVGRLTTSFVSFTD